MARDADRVRRATLPGKAGAGPANTAPPGSTRAPGVAPRERPGTAADRATADVPAAEAAAPPSTEEAPDSPARDVQGQRGKPVWRTNPFYLGFVGALGVLVAYWLAQGFVQARSIIVLLVVSMFLAVGLDPVVEWLIRRGTARGPAIAVVFVGVILAFVGSGFAVVPPLTQQIAILARDAPDYLEAFRGTEVMQRLDEQYGLIEKVQNYLTSGELAQNAFGGLVGVGRLVASAVFNAFTILVLTLYFLASLPSIKKAAYRLLPASRRRRVAGISDEILSRIGKYVAGQVVVALAAGVGTYIFLKVLVAVADAPTIGQFEVALALLAGLLSLVPFLGAAISAVLIIGIGFIDGAVTGLTCTAYYVTYQQFENYVLVPRVMSRSVDVPPTITIVAALVGGALLGVVGALLAIPVAAALLIVMREVVIPRMDTS